MKYSNEFYAWIEFWNIPSQMKWCSNMLPYGVEHGDLPLKVYTTLKNASGVDVFLPFDPP